MNFLKQKLINLLERGYTPEDSSELRLKKAALTLVPLIIGTAAFLWGMIYYLLGHPVSASIPITYSIISAITLIYYFRTKRTAFLELSQLTLVLFLPFLLMWSLGGFFNGSTVMIWALFSPIAASMFLEKKTAFYWFISYILLLFISGALNNYLESSIKPMPDLAITIFFILNLSAGSSGLYLLTSFTINQEKQAVDSLDKRSEELKEMNDMLLKANNDIKIVSRAKSEFLANMSHELRTPLHGILSYASLGLDKSNINNEEKINKYFTRILSSGKRLKVLLDDLLDLNKLKTGKMLMRFSDNNIENIIKDCIEEQAALISEHDLNIIYNMNQQLPAVNCDKNRIGQVVMNLLSNAIKFSPENGEIIFSAKPCNFTINKKIVSAVEVSVSDQGKGVLAGEEDSIFYKFVQGTLNDSSIGGTGLGLAITRELIHAHNGKIWCDNKVSRGVVFKFVIPVKQQILA